MAINEFVGYRFDGADGARFELINAPFRNEKNVTYLICRSGQKRVTEKFASLGIDEMRILKAQLQSRIDSYYKEIETWRIFDQKTRSYVPDKIEPDQPMRFDRIDDAELFAQAIYQDEDRQVGEYLTLQRFINDQFSGDSVVA